MTGANCLCMTSANCLCKSETFPHPYYVFAYFYKPGRVSNCSKHTSALRLNATFYSNDLIEFIFVIEIGIII